MRVFRRAILTDYLIYVIFAGMCLALAILIREREGTWIFLSKDNLRNIVVQTISYALLAVGMTFVIITGGIDLSVGGIVGFAGVLGCIALMRGHIGVVGSIAVGIAAGVAAGSISGTLVTRAKIPPFIATLAMWLITGYTGGLAFLITQGRPVWGLPDRFTQIVTHDIAGVPPILLVIAAAMFIGYIVLAQTRFGRNVYAVGGNEEAARLSGINVARVKLYVYMISGACAGLTGMVVAARLGSGDPKSGTGGLELDAIAAAVVGGTSLMGGKGSMVGTLAGVLILSALNNGLVMLGMSPYWQPVFRGSVILLAVLIDQFTKRAGR